MRGMGSVDRSESFSVGVLLAAAGGMLDAYTYLCRGGVFANAETGNMVLLGIAVLEGRLPDALRYFVPVLAYAAGVMISVFAERALRGRGRLWKQLTLAAEGAVLALALAFPGETFDFLVCVLVSFVCALQVQCFRRLNGNTYATTMCTGNLRSGTERLALYFGTRNARDLAAAMEYYGIIAAFICGAVAGAGLSMYFGDFAVALALIPLSAAGVAVSAGRNGRKSAENV